MTRHNVHASAVVVGGSGLLVLGASGSGKSILVATLVRNARAQGRFAALVADDQVWLSVADGRVIATAPAPIAGLIELRGFGPARAAFEREAVIDRVIRLVEPAEAPRLRETVMETVAGVRLPCLRLAVRNTLASASAVEAWLETSRFAGPEPI